MQSHVVSDFLYSLLNNFEWHSKVERGVSQTPIDAVAASESLQYYFSLLSKIDNTDN